MYYKVGHYSFLVVHGKTLLQKPETRKWGFAVFILQAESEFQNHSPGSRKGRPGANRDNPKS